MATVNWRDCAQWLLRCRVLAPSQHISVGTIDDLGQLLQDGVLLCTLLNRIEPRVIHQNAISYKPRTSQHLCRKNIETFLRTCKSHFHLRDPDLFFIDDLFEANNLPKVIKTLSVLSKTSIAQSLGITSFHFENIRRASIKEIDNSTSDDSARGSAEFFDDEEQVYQSLIDVVKEDSISPSQALTNVGSKRQRCISELISTEMKYVETLGLLVIYFMKPLSAILLPDDFNKIFFGIKARPPPTLLDVFVTVQHITPSGEAKQLTNKEFHNIHGTFCEKLKLACLSSLSSAKISDCFMEFIDKFVLYGEYCARLKAGQELIDTLCKQNSTIDVKLKQCQNNATEGTFKLRDMLSVPFQRILKYHLLLGELIKHSSDADCDRDKLDLALKAMLDLTLFINEMTRDYETIHHINELEKTIEGLKMSDNSTLCDYGRLLLDGEIRYKCNNSPVKLRYIFLFDKLMLVCRRKSEGYVYKDFIRTCDYTVDAAIVSHRSLANVFYFSLTPIAANGPRYSLGSKGQETVAKWVETIQLAKENVQPPNAVSSTHDFLLAKLEKPAKCSVCCKLLRGVFYQGYQCKITGIIVHKECIGKPANSEGVAKPGKSDRLQTYRSSRLVRKNLFGTDVHPAGAEASNSLDMRNRSGDDCRAQLRVEDVDQTSSECRTFSKPLYVNEPTQDSSLNPWFVGEMSREVAHQILSHLPSGSFLVRLRQPVSAGGVDSFALSLKWRTEPKHVRIEQLGEKFYLAASLQFNSIESLVEYYQMNSLVTHFHDITTTLTTPYRDAVRQLRDEEGSKRLLGFCVALYDYAPSECNQLTFNVDDVIVLLSKQHDRNGWWKGRLNGKTGYFPKAYVFTDGDDD